MIQVKVKKLHEDAVIPVKAHSTDAGFDLFASEDVKISAGDTKLVPTGLAFELPEGYEMQVRPRSGLSLKTPLKVMLGTVDAGYRGEVGIIVHNAQQVEYRSAPGFSKGILAGDEDFNITVAKFSKIEIKKGDKIAQAIIQKLPDIELVEVDILDDGDRGENGFGSTGV